MSHFAVLIIGRFPEGQLDSYWELDLNDEEIRRDYRAEFDLRVPAADIPTAARNIVKQMQEKGDRLAPDSRRLLRARRYDTILKGWYGGQQNEAGDWGYYRNPRAKWDWNVLGGRWQGSLHLLPGRTGETGERSWYNEEVPEVPGTCDQARFGDVDWDKTRPPSGTFTPFAVLKYGTWYEQGRMGWFGIACVFHAKWTEVPRETGQEIHGQRDNQSKRSDAGLGYLDGHLQFRQWRTSFPQ